MSKPCLRMESYVSEYLSVCEGNASESNATSDLWLVEDKTNGQVTAAFLLLFLVIGLPWNLLVIVTIVKQRLYTQPTIILLLNLVVADIVLLLLHVPFVIVTGFQGEFIFGDSDHVRCRICKVGFMSLLFTSNAIFTLSLMSFDRFLFIYKALQYERLISKWRTVVAIVVGWVIATLVSILPLTGFGTIVFDPNYISCILDLELSNSGYPVLVLIVLIIPVTFLIVCNIWLCCIVQRNVHAIYTVRKSMKLSNKNTHQRSDFYRSITKKRHEKELHLVKVFGALLCSSIVSFLPLIVVTLITFSGPSIPPPVFAVVNILYLSQVMIHPIIETNLIKELREPLKRILFHSCQAHMDSAKSRQTVRNGEKEHHSDQSVPLPDCCGCGFLNTCQAAVFFHHPHSTTQESASREMEDK